MYARLTTMPPYVVESLCSLNLVHNLIFKSLLM